MDSFWLFIFGVIVGGLIVRFLYDPEIRRGKQTVTQKHTEEPTK